MVAATIAHLMPWQRMRNETNLFRIAMAIGVPAERPRLRFVDFAAPFPTVGLFEPIPAMTSSEPLAKSCE